MMIICLIITDQFIKKCVAENMYNSGLIIIDGVLNLTYVENTGGAFGIGNNSTIMLIIVNVIVIAIIAKIIISKRNDICVSMLISLGLISAGGIGNLIDRIYRGFVIDYIDISPLIKYPVFNFADICVVLGCIIIMMNLLIDIIKENNK